MDGRWRLFGNVAGQQALHMCSLARSGRKVSKRINPFNVPRSSRTGQTEYDVAEKVSISVRMVFSSPIAGQSPSMTSPTRNPAMLAPPGSFPSATCIFSTESKCFPARAIAQAPKGAVSKMLSAATANMISPGPVAMPPADIARRGVPPIAAFARSVLHKRPNRPGRRHP